MYDFIRPLLFKLDAEQAHHLVLNALRWMPKQFIQVPEVKNPVQAFGLNFKHPVGLAAGLDKNGEYLDDLAKLGFSFIELGTVTPKPQEGNPKPRLFRIPEAQAIINRMGFNNQGVDRLVHHVSQAKYNGILGINIGKNKDTSLQNAAEDYLYCLDKVFHLASYVTINISSPNTPDLRQLQQGDCFINLINRLREQQKKLQDKYHKQVPLVVKVSPDDSDDDLKRMASVVVEQGISGIIATNTTCARDAVANLPHGQETGGLSGQPLAKRSTACLQIIKDVVGDAVTLIGVGGIDNIQSAKEKIKAGATLLQVYSGLIYKGPKLLKELTTNLDL